MLARFNDMCRETPDIETSSDAYADRFSGRAGAYFLSVQENAVNALLGDYRGKSVLDVGGGHGQLIRAYLQREFHVTVLGSTHECHNRIRHSFPGAGVRFITGNVLDIPCPDNSFDLVVSVRLISHIEAWKRLLSEFCRVAKQTVILDYPSWLSLNALTPLLFKLKRKIEKNTRTYTSFFEKDIANELQKHDFWVTKRSRQFLLPMFIHRASNGATALKTAESMCAAVGITRFFGSPVLLRADRDIRVTNGHSVDNPGHRRCLTRLDRQRTPLCKELRPHFGVDEGGTSQTHSPGMNMLQQDC